ncbi:hypothetical protein [Bacillus thuringiensis]|uniref:hypothetical protein n=1 Tax=Bacillus thuringiensis TaxID=1428 RepID=UPI001CFBEEB1|nr:hypothetical protein [Bacillus thuringiensis]
MKSILYKEKALIFQGFLSRKLDGLKSRFDTPDFKQAEEKLSTYQFANGTRINGGNVLYSFDSSLMEHLFHGELRRGDQKLLDITMKV